MTLFVDGAEAGSGQIARTHPLYFSFDEAMDVGVDTGMPVYEGYKTPRGRFSGTIKWAEIVLGDDDHSHLIKIPEEHLAAAMKHGSLERALEQRGSLASADHALPTYERGSLPLPIWATQPLILDVWRPDDPLQSPDPKKSADRSVARLTATEGEIEATVFRDRFDFPYDANLLRTGPLHAQER